MDTQIRCAAPCLFGVEGLLSGELRRLGAQNTAPENGRVLFDADPATVARVNVGSRMAERVQVVLGRFPAHTFDELFEGTRALPWEEWLSGDARFPVKGWSLDSTLHSVPDCQAIIKKAVVERMKTVYHQSWFTETGALYQIQFTLHKDEATLLLDTSGVGLHKRGYRAVAGGAPLKETLAAAIVDVADARRAPLVCDPCCGSGTLLIEAAQAACRIAPGLQRPFSAMAWPQIPRDLWKQEKERARESVRHEVDFAAWGGDVDPAMPPLTCANAAKAGVGGRVTAAVAPLSSFRPQGDRGVVLCNPPYGERLLDVRQAERLYRDLGRVLVPRAGWRYAIISPHERFEDWFGRKASKRRKLYNGMMKCQLFVFE